MFVTFFSGKTFLISNEIFHVTYDLLYTDVKFKQPLTVLHQLYPYKMYFWISQFIKKCGDF